MHTKILKWTCRNTEIGIHGLEALISIPTYIATNLSMKSCTTWVEPDIYHTVEHDCTNHDKVVEIGADQLHNPVKESDFKTDI